jgi:hypothetical protein
MRQTLGNCHAVRYKFVLEIKIKEQLLQLNTAECSLFFSRKVDEKPMCVCVCVCVRVSDGIHLLKIEARRKTQESLQSDLMYLTMFCGPET